MARALIVILIAVLSSSSFAVESAEESFKPLTIRYRERAPYLVKRFGEMSGDCGDIVRKALKKAKLDHQVVETPFFRQMANFQTGDAQECSVAWLKTSERETYLKFSEPICEDGPWVVVGHRGTVDTAMNSAEALLKKPELKVLRRAQFSFGERLDDLIEKNKTTVIEIENSELKQLFDMIQAGRADYTFLPEREFSVLVRKFKLSDKDFVVLKPDDLKGAHTRYMICSRNVPDAVIKKFNKAVSSMNLGLTESQ
ncbi:hypothetical protein [Bdellovibrio sp. HCB209]|uniref:hypothetical protein n=1 Tax=Bdellovibrio sp. HCB209 TaxID=3394354 RepID=UPI0039B6B057